MKTVFCDESGFTGENLWQIDQPHFAYAAVTIDPVEASAIVAKVRRDFSIKATELHTSQLLRRESGVKAIKQVLQLLRERSLVVVFHKRYSLAAKMFEYLFEPAISCASSIFYDNGFNKFVSNGIYLALLADPARTSQAFVEFQEIMRTGDASRLEKLAVGIESDALAGFLRHVATFITCNKSALQGEIQSDQIGPGPPRWLLELTMSGLVSLLTTLSGEEMVPLSVTCDDSKPLLQQASIFDGFVGRTDCHTIEFDGRLNQLTFNLEHKIKFDGSKANAGIQLADVVASSTAHALKMPNNEFAAFWRSEFIEALHGNSVVPDVSEVNLELPRPFVNAVVLQELVERSVFKKSLTHGMRAFIEYAYESLPPTMREQLPHGS